MTKKILPTPEQLRELLTYDPETGKLFWKERPIEMFASRRSCSTWNSKFSGKEGFRCISDQGYYRSQIWGINLKAHRVAWAIYYGSWPKLSIDHKNCNRLDNRIENLRLASQLQNNWNSMPFVVASSPLKGVYWDKANAKWRAKIKVEGKTVCLGRYASESEAHMAYKKAVAYRGEFARTE